MSQEKRKYKFNWNLIGDDVDNSRPSLGTNTTLEVYRIFQFSIRDVLEQRYGTDTVDDIFRTAGIMGGKAFYEKYCSGITDLNALASLIQNKFRELAIGIVRFEKVDLESMIFQLTVDEDLDCSGLPDTADQVCVYDEGFIKGLLDSFTGKDFTVKEIDCWCSGERTCRFRATLTT